MTDDQQVPQEVETTDATQADDTGTTVVGAVASDGQVDVAGAAVTEHDYAVIVAVFEDKELASSAYRRLQQAESSGDLDIEGVLVLETDNQGMLFIDKMTDHSTRTGAKWGAVGGVILGIFFPPSIIAATVGTAALGGVLGKLRNVWHKSEVSSALSGTLGPNESGILALVKAVHVEAVKAEMPVAKRLRTAGVDSATAEDIRSAAKQAS